jgi:transposase
MPASHIADGIEVFTGAGRRREWSPDQKATIIAESYRGEISDAPRQRRP